MRWGLDPHLLGEQSQPGVGHDLLFFGPSASTLRKSEADQAGAERGMNGDVTAMLAALGAIAHEGRGAANPHRPASSSLRGRA